MGKTSFCLDCDKRSTCKEICPELEKTLPKPRSGGNSKEFPTNNIDEVAIKWALGRRGRRKPNYLYNDNYELS